MSLPALGSLYNKGLVNGLPVWRQPGGPGTIVFPQFPTLYPQVPQGYPQTPFAYNGLYSFGCGHWANTLETFQEYDSVAAEQALLLCCPMCGYIQLIVEPASQWWDNYFGLWPLGFGSGPFN